ncbi:hypothetical protein M0M57_03870 [Flavobacterium azooxidireducens]|uniref:Carboxypeptidase-like regulatory domain-containing protein n=1 Tax=Flavobacterium azooxidireducens TaxID=1871076 RepID=A0ABY4KJP7_9FLAO|nr:hypothetical protein [Flavobacterium azooxidireducens]UPQ79978.1 hypothetical protein M0M57_03870 [Flavobacterium azooxidireducens]
MNRFFLYLIISILTTVFSYGQKTIYGVVKVENASAEGIHVTNLVSEKAAITNEKGEFWLDVKEDDLIVFSAVHLNYWRKSISSTDIKNGKIEIVMSAKVSELEEVVVTDYSRINAKDLGIINYTPKTYTSAERRLRTATTGLLDPLLNWMSGRTKQLKKDIGIEKKEFMISWLDDNFEDTDFTNTFKIPKEYVDGFKFYVVEDIDLAQAIQAKNKSRVTFLLGELAQDFLNYLNNEK